MMYHEDEPITQDFTSPWAVTQEDLRRWAIEQAVMLPTAKAADIQNVAAVIIAADKIYKYVKGE